MLALERSWASAVPSAMVQVGRVFTTVFGNTDLRRLELAYVAFTIAEYGTWVAVLVVAYNRGGAAAAGLIGAAQLVPGALFAPVVSLLGDRYRRERLLLAGYVAQAGFMALTAAVLLAGAPLIVFYAAATLAATAITVTRPLQGAILPSLAQTPRQLTGANVMAGWVEGVSLFTGPFLAGLLLAAAGPGTVFVVMTGMLLASAVLTAGISPTETMEMTMHGESGAMGELLGGVGAVGERPGARSVVTLMGADFLVLGALDILLVILALHLLNLGSSGAGYLNAVFGIGGLIGAFALATLSNRHIAFALVGGAAAWGVGMALIGILPGAAPAVILIGLAGTGHPLVDVAGRTLLQRAVADSVLARVFGLLEGLSMGAQALGMILAPLSFTLLGGQGTFLAAGVMLPALLALNWQRFWAIDMPRVPEHVITLLRSLPVFSPLPVFTLERLATNLNPIEVPAGTVIVREGDRGDLFYIVVSGLVEVSVGGHRVRTQGPGEVFGEIALLRDVPRTATVTARSQVQLYMLARNIFLETVTGHRQSSMAADTLVRERLATT